MSGTVANLASDLNGVTKLRGLMEAAGFINIEEQILRCPIGVAKGQDSQACRFILKNGNLR
jgi:hypothetical protein